MFNIIDSCRICGNKQLVEILDLGNQSLTGSFHLPSESVDKAPLVLVKCFHDDASKVCGLVQLKHTYDLNKMYGENYGYRSSLNASMIKHLRHAVEEILAFNLKLNENDLIIDIGSNDGTFLNQYPDTGAQLIGIDPTSKYFKQYYKSNIQIIENFFSAKKVSEYFPTKKAKIITSFSMFYDLENPQSFTDEIAKLLDEDGIWVLEQSYLPLMLKNNSFDTVCHEHLEYYSMKQIQWMFQKASLKIIDVKFNEVNGGSFRVYAAKANSSYLANKSKIEKIFAEEQAMQLDTLQPYADFNHRISKLKTELLDKIKSIRQSGQTIYGLGASTKGNVLLQYYNLDSSHIEAIGEVNADKFGKVTPGSLIPIEDEKLILKKKPGYLLVLPWHFKPFFEKNTTFNGVKLLFPLPVVEEIP
jgi:hypothetical protein